MYDFYFRIQFSRSVALTLLFVPISYFRKREEKKNKIKANKYNRSRIGSDRPRLQWLLSPPFLSLSLSRDETNEKQNYKWKKITLTQQEHWHDPVPANLAVKCDAWVRLDTLTAMQRTMKSSETVLTNRRNRTKHLHSSNVIPDYYNTMPKINTTHEIHSIAHMHAHAHENHHRFIFTFIVNFYAGFRFANSFVFSF